MELQTGFLEAGSTSLTCVHTSHLAWEESIPSVDRPRLRVFCACRIILRPVPTVAGQHTCLLLTHLIFSDGRDQVMAQVRKWWTRKALEGETHMTMSPSRTGRSFPTRWTHRWMSHRQRWRILPGARGRARERRVGVVGVLCLEAGWGLTLSSACTCAVGNGIQVSFSTASV